MNLPVAAVIGAFAVLSFCSSRVVVDIQAVAEDVSTVADSMAAFTRTVLVWDLLLLLKVRISKKADKGSCNSQICLILPATCRCKFECTFLLALRFRSGK